MQHITQDISIIAMIVTAALSSDGSSKWYHYDWEIVNQHRNEFEPAYRYSDAQVLLHLSLVVTNSNCKGMMMPNHIDIKTRFSLQIPSHLNWLTDIPIAYSMCPVEMISKGIPDSPLNDPTPLVRVITNSRDNQLYLIFTGTSNACMAGIDLDYLQTELEGINHAQPGMRAHRGMLRAYQSVREELIRVVNRFLAPSPQIIISGHSLGGALASICAFDFAALRPIQYSFASPLTFNPMAAAKFDQLVPTAYRIANISDIVTMFPLPLMPSGDVYAHVGTLVPFQRNVGEYHRNHVLAYAMELGLKFHEVSTSAQI